MRQLVGQLRMNVEKAIEPKAQALLETSAEVITGLLKSFEHYKAKREKAWQTTAAGRRKTRTRQAAR
jgi:hypothetical protein